MNKIKFATTNQGKVSSLTRFLSKYEIEVIQVPLELPEPRSDDLRKIAREKVLYAFERIREPCVALDSGFYVSSLNGFPKAFVNFALETIGVNGLLKLVEGLNRECEFQHCLAYMDSGLTAPEYFESEVRGRLANEISGSLSKHHWSPLSLIFIPEGEEKTLVQMGFDEYLQWREKINDSSYLTKFAEWFSKKY